MEHRFFTRDEYIENFGTEMVSANDVFQRLRDSGLRDNCLCNFDFHFISDNVENLRQLKDFLTLHYEYAIEEPVSLPDENLWELSGETSPIPVTESNLMYWALDMVKKGYAFDSQLEGYGAPFDPKEMNFPSLTKDKEDEYFEQAITSYNSENLSHALINFSYVIEINPKNSDAYYSRAIIKNELDTWKAALRDYDEALKITPLFLSALLNRGSLKDENDDHEGAIRDYDLLLKNSPENSTDSQMGYFNRGNSKFNKGDIKAACKDWKRAYESGADYALDRLKEHC